MWTHLVVDTYSMGCDTVSFYTILSPTTSHCQPAYADKHAAVACLQVTLALLTNGRSSNRQVTMTREKIAYVPVSHQMCPSVSSTVGPADANGKLGFVRISTFNKQTTESAKAAFRQLKADGATRCNSCLHLHLWL